MPLAKIHVLEGRYDEHRLSNVSKAVQDALISVLEIPSDDFFQIIHELPRNRFLHTPSFLGMKYSDDFIVLEVAFISGRPKETRLALLKELNARIVAAAGISPDDLMIQLSEFPGENFSFGQGLAQRALISPDVTEPKTVFHDEIDDRYSVRRIARSDAAGIDRAGESPRPAAELSSWVAEANGEIIGSISMVSVDNETGRLEQFHVASEWEADRRLARRLARTAADFARERGLLKLVIDVPEDFPGLPRGNGLSPTARAAEAESRVRAYFEMLGFVFSRKREVDGKTMLEFYLDLYQRPLIEPSESP